MLALTVIAVMGVGYILLTQPLNPIPIWPLWIMLGICVACYGGLISCLIDCHSNWTVMANHYRTEDREVDTLPRIDCVTGSLGIKYIKPTPMGILLTLKARVEGRVERKTRVLCEVYAGDTLTAVGDSVFVRVDVGHLSKTADELTKLG